MTDTHFIEQIDRLLKEYYGEDFEWTSVFASNFSKDVGFISINQGEGEIHNWQEFLDTKIKEKGIK